MSLDKPNLTVKDAISILDHTHVAAHLAATARKNVPMKVRRQWLKSLVQVANWADKSDKKKLISSKDLLTIAKKALVTANQFKALDAKMKNPLLDEIS